MNKRVIFIPGNGGGSPTDNWFPSVKVELEKHNISVVSEEFPDNDLARMSSWVPFITEELGVDENTILVGHSTGAIAAMRIAEKHHIHGSVLVGAYHTDLGIEKEKKAGYFEAPWQWDRIKQNQEWVIVFASKDDPWIPISEPRYILEKIDCEYHEYTNQGHFGGDYHKVVFPELVSHLIRQLEIFSDL